MIGLQPNAAACEISGPVIWNAPSPTSTSGRRPLDTCRPSAAGIANPIVA